MSADDKPVIARLGSSSIGKYFTRFLYSYAEYEKPVKYSRYCTKHHAATGTCSPALATQ